MTLHYEEEDQDAVKIEPLMEPERIKCFPLYTVLLAFNRTTVDLLSLGCQGTELEILQTSKIVLTTQTFEILINNISFTVPWDKVNIKVITIHLIHMSNRIDYPLYVSTLLDYMYKINYKKVWNQDRNFIFQKIQATD